MKNKNKLRNAIIKALGGFTEQIRPTCVDLPNLPNGVYRYGIVEVKSGVKTIDEDVSELRMKVLLSQHLAERIDREGFIKYDKKTDAQGTELVASITVAVLEDHKQEEQPSEHD